MDAHPSNSAPLAQASTLLHLLLHLAGFSRASQRSTPAVLIAVPSVHLFLSLVVQFDDFHVREILAACAANCIKSTAPMARDSARSSHPSHFSRERSVNSWICSGVIQSFPQQARKAIFFNYQSSILVSTTLGIVKSGKSASFPQHLLCS